MKNIVVILMIFLFYGIAGGQTLVTPQSSGGITDGTIEGPIEITGDSSTLEFDNGIVIDGGTANKLKIEGSDSPPEYDLELLGGNLYLDATDNATGLVDTFTGIIYSGGDSFLYGIKPECGTGNNIFLGQGAGNLELDGSGGGACFYEASGNIGIGASTLTNITTGYGNVGLGSQALQYITDGAENFGLGGSTLGELLSGSSNTGIGSASGQKIGTGATNLTIANYGIFIGYGANSQAESQTNEIVIGNTVGTSYMIGKGSNTVAIGNDDITANYLTGTLDLKGASGSCTLSVVSTTGTPCEDGGGTVIDIGASTSSLCATCE